jgi:hypothetical protein
MDRAVRLLTSPVWSWVQARKGAASAVVARPRTVARRRARTRMSPVVFSAVKTAPWKVKRVRVTSPPSRA